MHVNLKKERQIAWAVLGGVALLGLIVLWMMSDDGQLAQQLSSAEAEHAKMVGPEKLSDRIDAQRRANQKLARTIEELKKQVGFTSELAIKAGEQHNLYFSNARARVREELNNKAAQLSIDDIDDWFGFGSGKSTAPLTKLPPENEADFLLVMLQLTEKAAMVALNAPDPLERLIISHGDRPVLTGPQGRPPLLKEYPLTLKVRGSLESILTILHQLSAKNVNANSVISDQISKDYPLVITYFLIDSAKSKDKDGIQQLDATFNLAGMEFLSEKERGEAPAGGASPGAAPSGGGGRVRR